MVGLTGNYAGFAASALVKQEILGDVGSGDEFREGAGPGDIQNAGRILNAPPSLYSERFQERQQVIVRPESPEPSADRSNLCECLFFHGEIRV
jgi:hypothetical protein